MIIATSVATILLVVLLIMMSLGLSIVAPAITTATIPTTTIVSARIRARGLCVVGIGIRARKWDQVEVPRSEEVCQKYTYALEEEVNHD